MNRNLFRLVFSRQRGMLVAVAENAAGNRKAASGAAGAMAAVVLLAAGPATWGDAHAQLLPSGGVVQAGQISIGTPTANSLLVQQQSNRAVIDWQDFSIGSGNRVQFVQPGSGSVVLNRVTGSQQSSILGQLVANGGVFLTNPNGILFGGNAQVDVGHLVATTLGITNNNFMAGEFALAGASAASVVNRGNISGTSVALVAAEVLNSGSVTTPAGTTALVAGQSVDLDFNGDRLLAVRVNLGSEGGRIEHSGAISADASGRVIMTAAARDALLNTAINVTGRISARGATVRGGEVFLDSGAGGATRLDGAQIAVTSEQGRGGTATVLGARVDIAGDSLLDASGSAGGGVVLVGGNYQGRGQERSAVLANLGPQSRLVADATHGGNGGTVIVWSDKATLIEGRISARGGALSGDGGFVETSGKELLGVVAGASVDVGSRNVSGRPGTWLLDPRDVEIVKSGNEVIVGTNNPPGGTSGVAAYQVDRDSIQTALDAGNVTITTTATVSPTEHQGNIVVRENIVWSSTWTLTLQANHDISYADGVKVTGNSGQLVLSASTGKIDTAGEKSSTSVASFTATAGTTIKFGTTTVTGTGNLNATATGAVTQDGVLTVGGATVIAAGTGNVTLDNAGNNFSRIAVTGGAVSITDINALVLDAISATSLTLNTAAGNGNITQSVGTTITVASGATTVNAGTGNVTLENAGNNFKSVAATGGAVSITDINALVLDAISATSLTLNTSGAVTQNGAAIVSGATTVNAGTGDVTLDHTGNDFSSIALTGASLKVFDTSALTVTSITPGVNKKVDLQARGALSLPMADINTGTADLRLVSGASDDQFITPGNLSGANITVQAGGALSLAQSVTATGTLTATASGDVSQVGVLTVGGDTVIAAGAGNVTLAHAGNKLSGSISSTGTGAVVIRNDIATVLGAIGSVAGNAASLSVTTTNDAVTQTGAAVVGGATTVNAGAGDVTLDNTGNDFSSITLAGASLKVFDTSALAVTSITPGANKKVDLQAGGALGLPMAAIDTGTVDLRLVSGAPFTTPGNLSGANITVQAGGALALANNVTATGNLNATATGAVSQGGVLTVGGATVIAAGAGTVTLDNVGNKLTGAISSTGTGAVVMRNDIATKLGAIGATGAGNAATSLSVTTTGGAVTQTGAAIVGGTTVIAAGTGNVTLDHVGNKLTGSISSTGTGAVVIKNDIATELGAIGAIGAAGAGNAAASLSVTTTNDAVTQTGATMVSGATVIAAGTGNVTFDNVGNNLAGSISSTGTGAVVIKNDIATVLGAIGAAGAGNAASLSVTTTNDAVTQSGPAMVSGATAIAAGAGNVTLDHVGNKLTEAISSSGTGAVVIKNDIATKLGAIGSTGVGNAAASLSVTTTNDAVTQTGAAIVGGATTVNAVTGDVTLDNTGNDFSTITLTGASLTVRDTNALTVTSITPGANKKVDLQAGGALSLPAAAIDTGTADLRLVSGASGEPFTTPGNLSGANITVQASGALALANNVTAIGNLTATASGDVSQGGVLSVGGATVIAAGAGNVTLDNVGNKLSGSVSSTGTGAVVIKNDIATKLGAIGSTGVGNAAASLSVTTTNDAVTQSGAAIVGGATTVNAGAGDVTLDNTGNDFSTITLAGASLTLRDTNALTVTSISPGVNGKVDLQAGGALGLPAAAIDTGTADLRLVSGASGEPFTTPGNLSGANITVQAGGALALANNVTAIGNLTATASGDVTQGGVLSVGGATVIAAGTGNVTLDNAGNKLSGSISSTGTGAVVIRNDVATVLGAIGAAGAGKAASLRVTTTNDAVTQSGAAVVGGTTVIAAGAGELTLDHAGNNLAGSISSTGTGAVVIRNDIATVLGAIGVAGTGNAAASLSVTATNDAVTQTGAAMVSGTTDIAAGAGNVTLDNVGNQLTGAISSSGTGAVVIKNDVATKLGAIGATGAGNAAASLNVTTTDDAVTQTGAAMVSGATVIAAGAGDVTLDNAGNNFSSIALTGAGLTVFDSNALTVASIAAGTDMNVDIQAGGVLSLPMAGINTGAADLRLASGAALVTPGELSGANITLQANGALTLSNNVMTTGALTLNTAAGNGDITQSVGTAISAANGVTTVNAGSGNVKLNNPGNDFLGVALTGVNLTVFDTNALTVTSMAAGPDAHIDIEAAGALTLPGVGINTGTANLRLASGAPFTTPGDLRGANVALQANGALTLANNVTATGALTLNTTAGNGDITQSVGSSISAANGATTVNAGAGNVVLNNTGNNFSSVILTGASLAVFATNALTVTSMTAGADKNVDIQAGGALILPDVGIHTGTADLRLASGGTLATPGQLSGTNITLQANGALTLANNVTATGTLTLNTAAGNGNITQSVGTAISVANGVATVDAGTGNVALNNAANNFNSVAATGGAVSITDSNVLVLGAIHATSLTLNTSGAVTQNEAANVRGATTVNAGTTVVTLDHSGNNLAGPISSIGTGAVVIVNDIATVLGAIGATGAGSAASLHVTTTNDAVTQTAAATVRGATTVNAGTGDVTLTQANDFSTVTATGGAVSITDTNALVLGAINAASLTLNTAGSITQNAAANVRGATTVNAGTADVTLTQANDFNSVAVTAANLSISDDNSLALRGTMTGSLTTVAGSVAFGETTVGGDLTVTAGGMSQDGALHVTGLTGKTILNSPAAAIALSNPSNELGGELWMNLGTGNASVTSSRGMVLGPSNFGSADVVLTALGNHLPGVVINIGPVSDTEPDKPSSKASFRQTGVLESSGGSLVLASPTDADVLLNDFTNDLKGTIATASRDANPIDNFQLKSLLVQIGVGGLTARNAFLWANEVTTPSGAGGGIRLVRRPLPDAASPLLNFRAISGIGIFGLPGRPWIYVDTDDHVTVFPNSDNSAGAGVYLEGVPDYRPSYEFKDDPTKRTVRYNGESPDSPQFLGALISANAPLRDALKDALSSGFSKENLRKQLAEGSVLQTGVGQPGIDKIENATDAESCDVAAGSLRCAAQ